MTGQGARRTNSTRIEVPPTLRGLDRVLRNYERFARQHSVPDDVRKDLQVALEELVSNVVRHGAGRGARRIEVTLTVARGAFRIDIVDDGPRFNPFAAPEPDPALPLADRPIGGLGILIVRRLTAHRYSRRGNCNHVILRRALGWRERRTPR